MGRPSLREVRRAELVRAFARTLGTHGQRGATIGAVAAEAGLAPGMVHHYFADKRELYDALLSDLAGGFRRSLGEHTLEGYAEAALGLGPTQNAVAARAWVGVIAEALGDPSLLAKLKRTILAEVTRVERLSAGRFGTQEASAVVAFVLGALVFGAVAPRSAAGFAAPALRTLIRALRERPSPRRSATLGGRRE